MEGSSGRGGHGGPDLREIRPGDTSQRIVCVRDCRNHAAEILPQGEAGPGIAGSVETAMVLKRCDNGQYSPPLQ
jgi:hypothetical protein